MVKIRSLLSIVILTFTGLLVSAAEPAASADLESLSKEAIAKAKTTENVAPTPEIIMQKVREAAKLVETEGPVAFPKFRGNSNFIFNGTYIWIHDSTGKMIVHPITPKMEGKDLLHLKDTQGKFFFVDMNKAVQENSNGEAWVDYWWPKPGTTTASQKVSFVKKVVFGGVTYVIGCGVYDLDISKVR